MKPSGIDWIGDIPASWKRSKVKFCFSLVNGSTPESSDYDCWDGDIKWITPADMSDTGTISHGERLITKYGYNSCGTTLLPIGSIVISSRAPIGKINITTAELCTNQGCKSLIRTGDNRYFYYLFLAGQHELSLLGRGTTFLELSTYDLNGFGLVIPAEDEQKAIADFLDKECAQIDSIAADLEKQVTLLQQYKKSLITETVTKGLDKSVPMKDSGVEFFGKIPAHWKVSKTKYVADISIGLVTTMTANYVDEDGVPLIRNSNIRTNHIDDNGMVYLSKEFAKANIGRALHKGDIVTVHTGDVGTSAIINETYHMSHGFATIISRLKTKTVNNQFLCWLYNSEIFKEMSIAYSTGDGRQNLNLYDFVDFYILIPTLKEQMEIVNWLNLKCTEIDNFIENKQQQLLLIQQHKKSLIYEYVTGKKRVKEVR